MKKFLQLILLLGLFLFAVAKPCPTNLTGSAKCTLPKKGGEDCNDTIIKFSSQCTEQYSARFDFTYCNPNAFPLTINATTSYFRNEYKNFTWTNMTILPNTTGANCYTISRWSYLKNCDRSSWTRLNINARSVDNYVCNLFIPLNVYPIITQESSSPSGAPVKKPTIKPTAKVYSRKPTKRTTVSPLNTPSPRPTVKPFTFKPITRSTAEPSKRRTETPVQIPSRPPSARKPSTAPSKRPTKSPTKSPTTVKGPTRKPTAKKTIAPTAVDPCGSTKTARSNGLTATVSSISTSIAQALTNSSSPQSLALSWLINQDGLYLCPTDTRVRQRFIVASFYFSTGGDSSWVMCGRNSVQTCSITQTLTFVQGDNTTYLYGNAVWLTAVDECSWGGTMCFVNGTLERIEFNRNAANKLRGTIPGEITLLSNMRTLVIESCCSTSIPTYNVTGYAGIQGTIPSGIGNLQSMFTLNLAYNFLTGTVPTSIVTLSKLREISLQYNNLVGSFPSPQNATQLTKIKFVCIESNSFNGTVPTIVNSQYLSNFTLHANKITGQMPQAICNLRATTLVVLTADCSASSEVAAKVNCPCCTQCF